VSGGVEGDVDEAGREKKVDSFVWPDVPFCFCFLVDLAIDGSFGCFRFFGCGWEVDNGGNVNSVMDVDGCKEWEEFGAKGEDVEGGVDTFATTRSKSVIT